MKIYEHEGHKKRIGIASKHLNQLVDIVHILPPYTSFPAIHRIAGSPKRVLYSESRSLRGSSHAEEDIKDVRNTKTGLFYVLHAFLVPVVHMLF